MTHSLTTLSFVARDLVRLLVLVSWSRRALAPVHARSGPRKGTLTPLSSIDGQSTGITSV